MIGIVKKLKKPKLFITERAKRTLSKRPCLQARETPTLSSLKTKGNLLTNIIEKYRDRADFRYSLTLTLMIRVVDDFSL